MTQPIPPQPSLPPQPQPISPQAQPDVDPRRPQFARLALPVATTESLPGAEVAAVLGVVIGISTRPRDMAHHPEMAYINTRARQEALAAMVTQAQEIGADAVLAVRFEGDKISDTVSELTAYGTAVVLRRLAPPQQFA